MTEPFWTPIDPANSTAWTPIIPVLTRDDFILGDSVLGGTDVLGGQVVDTWTPISPPLP